MDIFVTVILGITMILPSVLSERYSKIAWVSSTIATALFSVFVSETWKDFPDNLLLTLFAFVLFELTMVIVWFLRSSAKKTHELLFKAFKNSGKKD